MHLSEQYFLYVFMFWSFFFFNHCILTIRFAGMGNLLKVLTREIENYPHFFLDFESKSGRRVEQNMDKEV